MNEERILKILLSPHMSEKALKAVENHNQYVFKVLACATKPEIKSAVEHLFKTQVEKVQVLNSKSKPKRFGKVLGKSKAWKKAYVTLKEGQEISVVEA